MTAGLMLLPLILAALDEILIRQRHCAAWSGVALGLLVFATLFGWCTVSAASRARPA